MATTYNIILRLPQEIEKDLKNLLHIKRASTHNPTLSLNSLLIRAIDDYCEKEREELAKELSTELSL